MPSCGHVVASIQVVKLSARYMECRVNCGNCFSEQCLDNKGYIDVKYMFPKVLFCDIKSVIWVQSSVILGNESFGSRFLD